MKIVSDASPLVCFQFLKGQFHPQNSIFFPIPQKPGPFLLGP
ncbi:hypothetical protein LEP1GSC185_2306 [Leptospira licerasiae serovar Varillal str. VAR 010]|uniref:Uncharacterized protein n=1 Tax=Leptospira licerasiae str. MMD4847 TaxID=1049971 RepID=A0ABN0H3M5_9LEPT|nr:hypothetical protein LEP1GSC185_2306 [Leptospira licerasiae serovar Varillal str. VAR 010]EJZ40284.1 hypothetical protein LEP1GSC178_1580 [Leptospira licerasiae str. MMD4847]